MANPRMPSGLGAGGRALWKSVSGVHEIDGVQAAQLTEACRMKDRLDQLDKVLRGDVQYWTEVLYDADGSPVSLRIDAALQRANDTANAMKQLISALRLPDAEGRRPQRRGPRGAQKPTVPGGAESRKVSSLERARERAAAKSG